VQALRAASTAESAWNAVRTTLILYCGRVRLAAAVWQWKRSRIDSGSCGEPVAHDPRIGAAHGPELGDLLEEVVLADEEERQAGAKSSTFMPVLVTSST